MTIKTIDIADAQAHLNSIDIDLKQHRVIVVTRHKAKAFALVDLDYLSSITETVEILSDPQAMQELHQSQDDIQAGRLYSHDEIEKEFG